MVIDHRNVLMVNNRIGIWLLTIETLQIHYQNALYFKISRFLD